MPVLTGGVQIPEYPGDHFHYVFSKILMAGRANGLQVIDGPYLKIRDPDGFRDYCQRTRMLGYDGKWALHPDQVTILNEVFSPTQEQFDRAWDILDAYHQATEGDRKGAVMFGDEMIDEASRKMAIKFVSRGERAGLKRSSRPSTGADGRADRRRPVRRGRRAGHARPGRARAAARAVRRRSASRDDRRAHYAGMRAEDARGPEHDDWDLYRAYVALAVRCAARRAVPSAVVLARGWSPHLWRYPLGRRRCRRWSTCSGAACRSVWCRTPAGRSRACSPRRACARSATVAACRCAVRDRLARRRRDRSPTRRIFVSALEVLGLPPDRIAYVGDCVRNDVRGAEAAGLMPLLLDPLRRPPATRHERIEPPTTCSTWSRRSSPGHPRTG